MRTLNPLVVNLQLLKTSTAMSLPLPMLCLVTDAFNQGLVKISIHMGRWNLALSEVLHSSLQFGVNFFSPSPIGTLLGANKVLVDPDDDTTDVYILSKCSCLLVLLLHLLFLSLLPDLFSLTTVCARGHFHGSVSGQLVSSWNSYSAQPSVSDRSQTW